MKTTQKTHRTGYTTPESTEVYAIPIWIVEATPCPSYAPTEATELTFDTIQDMPPAVLAWKIRNRVIM